MNFCTKWFRVSHLHLLFQVEKTCSSNPSELLLYPAKEQTKTSSPLPAVNSNSSSAPVPTSNIPADKPSHSPAQQRPPSTHLTRSGSRSPQSPPSSSSTPSPPSSPATLSPDLKLKLEELLEKYSNGLWAHALPKLFQDTYKVSIPLKHYHIKVITKFRSELFIYIYIQICIYIFLNIFYLIYLQGQTSQTCTGEPSPPGRLLHHRLPDA